MQDKRRKLFEARRSHLSQSKYVNEQHLGKEKFTVSHILREFEQFTKEEKQKKMSGYIQELDARYNKKYHRGRDLSFITGFSFKQCLASPSDHQAFYTVQHIDLSQREKNTESSPPPGGD